MNAKVYRIPIFEMPGGDDNGRKRKGLSRRQKFSAARVEGKGKRKGKGKGERTGAGGFVDSCFLV